MATRRTSLAARSAALVAALTLALVACGSGGADDGTRDRQALVDDWRTRAGVPAVVLAVQQGDDDPSVTASGTTERGGGEPVAADAPFRIGSITKTFVATVVLQLEEEGKLGLDDAVTEYVPDFASDATVRQLLNHTAGVPDYAMSDGFGEELLEDRDRHWTPAELLALVEDLEPDFDPGTDYRYSNTHYVLLGEVVESVTGSTWAQEVRRRILDPLGLDSTYVAGLEPATAPVVPAYFDADNDGDQENVETSEPWTALETSEDAAGAIVSTAADVLAFGDALFRGDLLSEESFDAMVAEGPFHPRNSSYGLGVEIVRPDYRTTIWGHGGFVPGFRSVLWYVPSSDALVVVLANDSRANPADLAELAWRALPAQHG